MPWQDPMVAPWLQEAMERAFFTLSAALVVSFIFGVWVGATTKFGWRRISQIRMPRFGIPDWFGW